ncbi:hypothetical protein [Streptomyces echinatus]|uniref:Uncharacterized protein n=1 Tax=Streptomyces echinatus TaxID=67293 RepID=A0A7W9PSK1_9ACTN|nr:hypothetical protein [Streptomyces echinatus]MBB5926638.1 hypothetical protein [Streptomyces echinatus]
MTTAYSESSTERVPGRAWTIRLIGHRDHSATLSCSREGCRMPARSKDLAALRAFAARHAAAHAKAATVRPNAFCYCGSQQCSAHPGTVHCAGAVVLILRHDPAVGQVWSVEEVCAACAPLIPNATVVARAARQSRNAEQPAPQIPAPASPGIPGGFSSPGAAPAEGQPAPARRSGRPAQRRRRPGQQR